MTDDPVKRAMIAARRDQILNAAESVFAQNGFHATKTRDIARAAGISEGTIYNYFDNKEALIAGLFDRMREQIMATKPKTTPPNADPAVVIQQMVTRSMDAFEDDDGLLRVIMSEMLINQDMRQLYADTILRPTLALGEEYLEQQLPHMPQEQRALLVRVLSALATGLTIQRILGDDTLSDLWSDIPEFLTQLTRSTIEEN